MSTSPPRHGPCPCRIRLDGHLDAHWSSWLEPMELTHDSDGTTTLTGVIADQAQLHGVLTRIRDLGVPLISVAVGERAGIDSGPERSEVRPGAGRHFTL